MSHPMALFSPATTAAGEDFQDDKVISPNPEHSDSWSEIKAQADAEERYQHEATLWEAIKTYRAVSPSPPS